MIPALEVTGRGSGSLPACPSRQRSSCHGGALRTFTARAALSVPRLAGLPGFLAAGCLLPKLPAELQQPPCCGETHLSFLQTCLWHCPGPYLLKLYSETVFAFPTELPALLVSLFTPFQNITDNGEFSQGATCLPSAQVHEPLRAALTLFPTLGTLLMPCCPLDGTYDPSL